MALATELLALLRCPETMQPLAIAAPAQIARLETARLAGTLRDRSGKVVAEPIEGGLLREDGAVLYPIRAGIPVLISAEAVVMP